MRHVTVGQFVPGDSPVHRLDPRTKIFLLVAAMVVTFNVSRPASLAAMLVWCVAGALAAGLTPRYFLGGLRAIAMLLAITVAFNMLLVRGGPLLYALGPLRVTQDGVSQAGLMAARLSLLMLLTSLFTLTTSPIRMTDALEKLLAPLRILRVPTTELAMMTSIALRFIPTLVECAERIIKAQMARGARFDQGGPLGRARVLVPVLVPLFVQAFGAAEDLAVAMEARCYRGGVRRTRMVGLEFRWTDVLALLLGGLLLAGTPWLP